MGYVISDALENGGIKKNWNFISGDFLLVIASGRHASRVSRIYLSSVHHFLPGVASGRRFSFSFHTSTVFREAILLIINYYVAIRCALSSPI